MKVSRSKTEYRCKNEENDDETVKMENTNVPRVKEFKYLGLTWQESGNCEKEVKKRVHAGWNRWRRVSGVICDRRLPARVKEKLYGYQKNGKTSNDVWDLRRWRSQRNK